jgi:hypothetical protein
MVMVTRQAGHCCAAGTDRPQATRTARSPQRMVTGRVHGPPGSVATTVRRVWTMLVCSVGLARVWWCTSMT